MQGEINLYVNGNLIKRWPFENSLEMRQVSAEAIDFMVLNHEQQPKAARHLTLTIRPPMF